MERFLVKFKDTSSVSSFEAGLLCRIPIILRQGSKGKAFVQGELEHIDKTLSECMFEEFS